jgi:hypothetical protein
MWRWYAADLFTRKDAQILNAVLFAAKHEIAKLFLFLLCQRYDQAAVPLESKVQIVIQISKHLIALPAVLGAVGA